MKTRNKRAVNQKGPTDVWPRKIGVILKGRIKTEKTRLTLSLSQVWKAGGKLALQKGTLVRLSALSPAAS